MSKSVTFLNTPIDIGGPGTFQINFSNYCKHHGIDVFSASEKHIPKNILIISASKKLLYILKCKFINKTRVIQRLDGFEFLEFKWSQIGKYLKIEYNF